MYIGYLSKLRPLSDEGPAFDPTGTHILVVALLVLVLLEARFGLL